MLSASPGRSASKSNGRQARLAELAFLSLGSNIDPEANLTEAFDRLALLGRLKSLSEVYENPAVGGEPQPDFLNAVVALEVDLDPDALRTELRRIETELGRVRTADKYAPRTIDLDLLLYGDQVIVGEQYRVPDPELTRRAHLAIPLAELAPERLHPELGESFAAIAGRLRPDAQLRPRPELKRRLLARPSPPPGHGR